MPCGEYGWNRRREPLSRIVAADWNVARQTQRLGPCGCEDADCFHCYSEGVRAALLRRTRGEGAGTTPVLLLSINSE